NRPSGSGRSGGARSRSPIGGNVAWRSTPSSSRWRRTTPTRRAPSALASSSGRRKRTWMPGRWAAPMSPTDSGRLNTRLRDEKEPTMRIVISDFISLDGVVQAPGGSDEDTDGGFQHGGWSMPFFDPEVMGSSINEVAERTDALLYGRRTWQVMAGAWPGRAGDPFADWINAVEKHVVSNTLSEADLTWAPTSLIRGADFVAGVTALRERPGRDVNVIGSARLVRSLLEADLVDEL